MGGKGDPVLGFCMNCMRSCAEFVDASVDEVKSILLLHGKNSTVRAIRSAQVLGM